MSTRSQTLRLPLRGPRAEAVCARAIADLGWSVHRAPDGVVLADEDPVRLHCHCAPCHAEIALAPAGDGGTTAVIAGRVEGRGPISAKHARERVGLLARRIGLEALREADG